MEPDLIATEMLVLSSNSLGDENDSDPINEKTTPIYSMGIISIVLANDSDNFRTVRASLSNPVLQYYIHERKGRLKIRYNSILAQCIHMLCMQCT